MRKGRRFILITLLVLFFALVATACATAHSPGREYLVDLHCMTGSEDAGQKLLASMAGLAARGVNSLFLEVGYGYDWKSHPELSYPGALSQATADAIRQEAKRLGLALIPEINCVGHQSWEAATDRLLETYPEFDETPGQHPNNEGIYCRSWCVSNEAVYPLLFDLFDELVAVFGADGVSVGMDEVFLIGEDSCSRCRGKDKGELFALAVRTLHAYLAGERGLTMHLWGDRLINGANPATDYGNEWETSLNGTWTALDQIPKDLVICDWHYAEHPDYGSLAFFLDKGFRVLGASYQDVAAARAFVERSLDFADNRRMLGHLYTTWGVVENDALADWPPLLATAGLFRAPR